MSQHIARLVPLTAAVLLCFASAPGFGHEVGPSQKGVGWARSGDMPVDAATAARLSALTNQVIAAIGEYQAGSAARRGQVSQRLRQLAAERKALLRSTMQGAPGLALRSTIPSGMTQSLPPDVRQQLEQDIEVEGRIVLLHGEDAQMRNAMNRFYVESTDAHGRRAQWRLHAADKPDVPGIEHPAMQFVGQAVTVRATAIDGELLIAGAQSIEAASSSTSTGGTAAIEAATVAGTQNTLVLTANFSDRGLACSPTDIYNKVFGGANSVADYYRQSSKGNVTFSGTMYGPFQLGAASTATCDFQNWSAQVEQQAAAQGINLSAYPRRVFVFPTSSCGIGYGSMGTTPTRSWIFRCDLLDLYTHEIGHNLGMHHASTPSNEYGDTSDVMGYSGMALRHHNAPNKVSTGWLGSSWVRSVSSSGIFTLDATANGSPVNPQVLTLPKPDTGDNYYISFRQPIGYDATLSGGYQNQVSIHRGRSSMGQYTYLLGVLGAGATYTDSANGYTFAVNSIGTTSATVSVTTSTTTVCTRSAPTVAMAPLSQSAAPGNSISYQVSVTNNNGSGCGATSFAFSNAVPAGWSSSDSPTTLTLNSGASGTKVWTVTSSTAATQASYPVSTTAYDTAATTSAATAQGSFVVTVSDSILPTVSITSPLNGARVTGNRTTVTANAGDNVGVAKVEFYVDGRLTATDTSAPYSFNWNTRKLAGGSYTLTARAFDAAGNSASSSITVTK